MKNLIITLIVLFTMSSNVFAWHDQTHLAVGKAAGYSAWYNLAAPDIAKVRAGEKESFNHWLNATSTPDLSSFANFGEKGNLLNQIVTDINTYIAAKAKGKYGEYSLVYVGHYCGDLSMPLHMTTYDAFNKKHHNTNDATVEEEVLDHISNIKPVSFTITDEASLKAAILSVATKSYELGVTLRKENRDMTKSEAYAQLSQSAGLFKAILVYVGK